jgi:DNA ligase (NAD+)
VIRRTVGEAANRCNNISCPARIKASIAHFVSKGGLDIDGFGIQLIDQLVERRIVKRLSDIFQLTQQKLAELERMGERSAAKLIAAIEASKQVPFSRFLFALGIPFLGAHTAETLASHFLNLNHFLMTTEEELSQVPGIGPRTAESIINYIQRSEANRKVIDELLAAGVIITRKAEQRGKLYGKRFVFTGTLQMVRAEAVARVHAVGGRVSSSVLIDTDYIVVGENPGTKLQRAIDLKIKVLTEVEFKELLTKNE